MKMKKLKDLKGRYGSKDISNLVAFAQDAPIMLQDNQNYQLDKSGKTIHIYGVERGIEGYEINYAEDYVKIGNVRATKSGIEIDFSAKGIEKIILHNDAYRESAREAVRRNPYGGRESLESRTSVGSGESRGGGESNGESRGYSGGESRGESRGESNGESRGLSSGESRGESNGESRGYSGGESRGLSSGESRGESNGESRW